jgi:hypothetical protein
MHPTFCAQAFEDEDFMDPDKDTRLTNILKEGPAQPAADRPRIARPASQPALGAAAGPSAPQPPPASRAPQPQPPGGGAPAAAAGAKRPRSPDGQGELPVKVARVDEPVDANLAALEAVGITVSEFKAAIPASGITLKDIMKRFKKRLPTATAKEAFTELMRRFTRFDQAKGMVFPKQ